MQTPQVSDKCETVMHFSDGLLKDSAVIWKFQHVNTFKSLIVVAPIQKGVELFIYEDKRDGLQEET